MLKPVGNVPLLLAVVATSAFAYGAWAQEDAEPRDAAAGEVAEFETLTLGEGGQYGVSGDCNCLGTRLTLTGDWCGYRTCLQQSGVTFAGRSTHFAFGIDGGIDSPLAADLLPLGMGDTFKYTGRGEYDLIFDLEKFGGLPYGRLLVRAEHWYGEFGNVSLHTGALTPAVFPALLPPVMDGEGVPYITNFLFTQPLSEKLIVFAGKKDVLGAADQDIFAGGDGTSQFSNQAFIANPAFLLALPMAIIRLPCSDANESSRAVVSLVLA